MSSFIPANRFDTQSLQLLTTATLGTSVGLGYYLLRKHDAAKSVIKEYSLALGGVGIVGLLANIFMPPKALSSKPILHFGLNGFFGGLSIAVIVDKLFSGANESGGNGGGAEQAKSAIEQSADASTPTGELPDEANEL